MIDRRLVYQVANAAFGEVEALRRSQEGDPQVLEAVRLLRGVESPAGLLELVWSNGEAVMPQASGSARPSSRSAAREAVRN